MRSRTKGPLTVATAAVLLLGLSACDIGQSFADDCWVNREALDDANRFRLGLKARNVAPDDGGWAVADARIARARTELQACEDGARGTGRPHVADLGGGHDAAGGGHEGAGGSHGSGGHGA